MITLGQKAKDKITGYAGILVARAQYITGCDQYGIQPPAADGKVEKAEFFDEGRIEIIGPGITEQEVQKASKPGGPSRDVPHRPA